MKQIIAFIILIEIIFCFVIAFIGFHNIDIGRNMLFIEKEYNTELYDKACNDCPALTSTEIYLRGCGQLNGGLIGLTCMALFLFFFNIYKW